MSPSDEVTDSGRGVEPAPETTPAEPLPAPPATRRERLSHRAYQVRLYGWTTLLVAALVVVISLIVDNTHRVKIGWVFGSSHASLVWIILVAAFVGWLAGLATTFVVRRRIRRGIGP